MTTNDPAWVMPVPADVLAERGVPLVAAANAVDHAPLPQALDDECPHLLTLATCVTCKDAATGRPTGTPLQVWSARGRKVRRVVPTNGVIRPLRAGDPGYNPADPAQQWTYDEWMSPEHRARRKATLSRLRSYDRDRYEGRTLGPRDPSIKPINRTRR